MTIRLPSRAPSAAISRPVRLRRHPRRGLGLLSLALFGALALALALGGCGIGSDPLLAASVDGHPISVATYQQMVAIYKEAVAQQGQQTDWQSPQGRVNLASVESQALDLLTSSVLLDEQMPKQHLKISAKDLTTAAQNVAQTISGWSTQSPGEAGLKAWSTASRQATKQAAHASSLTDLLASRASESDALLIIAYNLAEQNMLSAKARLPTAHVRVIVVKTRNEAAALEAQAQHGTDFGALARQHSLDTGTAQQGGETGKAYYFVGELSQIDPQIDRGIFGSSASQAKVSYVIAPLSSGGSSQYVLCEITHRGVNSLSTVTDAQTRNTILGNWISVLVRPSASVQQYVAVDPTATSGVPGQ